MPPLLLLLLLAQADPRQAFLTRQLESAKDPRARAQAALLLGASEEPSAVPLLCAALGDGTDLVRSAAARALGTLEAPTALTCLAQHAQDSVPEVRDSIASATRALEAIVRRPVTLYVALTPLAEASPAATEDERALLDERLRVKLQHMGVKLAPPTESSPAAKGILKKLKVKGFLLRPVLSPQGEDGLQLRVLCMTYPEKAILGEVSVQASGADPPDLIRALAPKALEEAADTFDWRLR